MMAAKLIVKDLGVRPYDEIWQQMKRFTDERNESTPDELWLVQHSGVYTLGQTGKQEHVLDAGNIPVLKTDRGGQVTYHGPGQLVCYLLLDIRRLGIGVRDLVTAIEASVIQLLARHNVDASSKPDAPGVYVEGKKVAALGLRIRKGRSYHGLSLNVDMDLAPFSNIDPCGYPGLEVTDTRRLGIKAGITEISRELTDILCSEFGYHAHPTK
jgi:lipoyl(octanoyl) transferase